MNITGPIELDYGLFRNIIDPTMLREVHLHPLARMWRPEQIIDAVMNIKNLHLTIGIDSGTPP
jgi:hypothetical protein